MSRDKELVDSEKDDVKKVLNEGYPNADSVMARGVLLPLHHGLTETMFSRFQATVDEFVARYDLVYKQKQ